MTALPLEVDEAAADMFSISSDGLVNDVVVNVAF